MNKGAYVYLTFSFENEETAKAFYLETQKVYPTWFSDNHAPCIWMENHRILCSEILEDMYKWYHRWRNK